MRYSKKRILAYVMAFVMFLGIFPLQSIVKAAEADTKSVSIWPDYSRKETSLCFVTDVDDGLAVEGEPTYGAISGGVYVDGSLQSHIKLTKYDFNKYYIYWGDYGIVPTKGMKVRIDGTFGTGTQQVEISSKTFEYFGTDGWYMYNDELVIDINTARQDFVLFYTTKEDATIAIGDHTPVYGGIYVDGTLDSSMIINHYGNKQYHIYGLNFKPVNGTQVTVNGIFGNSRGDATKFVSPTFIYDATANAWTPAKVNMAGVVGEEDLRFKTFSEDVITTGLKRGFLSGGIYINDTLTDVKLTKSGNKEYILAWADTGMNSVAEGTKVKVSGILGSVGRAVVFSEVEVVYTNGSWILAGESAGTTLVDATVQASSRSDAGSTHLFFNSSASPGEFLDIEMEYKPIAGGVYLEGSKTPSNMFLMRNGSSNWYIYFGWFNYTPKEGSTIRIDGVFQYGKQRIQLTSDVFTYNGGVWQLEEKIEALETKVLDHSRADIADSHMFFITDGDDGKMGNAEMFYHALRGGIYVNNTLYTSVTFRRNAGSQYFIWFPESGLPTPTDGMQLRFDGIFRSGDSTLAMTSDTFVYDATTCQWTIKDMNIISVAYDSAAFAEYRADLTAPTKDGYVFAGWYADEECEQVLVADAVEEKAYAKFVNEKVLTVKTQVTAGITEESEKADIRFVTSVDSVNYKEVGFYITIAGLAKKRIVQKTVYTHLYYVGKGAQDYSTATAKEEFCSASEYFATYSYWNVPQKHFGTKFTVEPYWVTMDGTEVCGEEVVRTVNMGAGLTPEESIIIENTDGDDTTIHKVEQAVNKGGLISFDIDFNYSGNVWIWVLANGNWGTGNEMVASYYDTWSGKKTISCTPANDIEFFTIYVKYGGGNLAQHVCTISNLTIFNVPYDAIGLTNTDGDDNSSYAIDRPLTKGSTLSFDIAVNTKAPVYVWVLADGLWGTGNEFSAGCYDPWDGKETISCTATRDAEFFRIYVKYTDSNLAGMMSVINNIQINGEKIYPHLVEISEGQQLYFGPSSKKSATESRLFDAEGNSLGTVKESDLRLVESFGGNYGIYCYTVGSSAAKYINLSKDFNGTYSTYILKGEDEAVSDKAIIDTFITTFGVEKPAQDTVDVLSGKRALFVGDSITYGACDYQNIYQYGGWAGRIGYYGDMEVKNNGVSGACITNIRESQDSGLYIYNQLTKEAGNSYDYVIMHGLYNDWGFGADTALFKQSLGELFDKAKEQHPDAILGYIINFKVSGQETAYVEIAKEVCEAKGIPYLNLYEDETFEVELYDGLHPTSAGYDSMYAKVADWMADITEEDVIAVTNPEGETDVWYDLVLPTTIGQKVSFDLNINSSERATVWVLADGNWSKDAILYASPFEAWEGKTKITVDIPLAMSKLRVYVKYYGETPMKEKVFTINNVDVEGETYIVPTLFGDGMMFQQNKEMNIWGYGPVGSSAVAKLYKGDILIETKETSVASTGKWEVAFAAREGGYDTYRIELTLGNKVQKIISDVLIGELWIAAGQSNMELTVEKEMNAEELLSGANNANIRMYLTPTWPYGQSSPQPANPQIDVPGAYWGYGNNRTHVANTSAVAWVFATNLQEELNVPVGILNIAVGGYPIEAWLSREAIDSDAQVKAGLQGWNMYYTEETYETLRGGATATIYNQKVGPLEGTNVAGLILYIGESNVGHSELFGIELDLLKRSWGEAFGFDDGDMPLIFTQIAPYRYADYSVGYLSMYMERGWKLSADKNTAMVTLYDIALEHLKGGVSTDPIHPRTKIPVGERFYQSALNMVYGGTEEYTAPVYKSMEIRDGAIYVTFDRVGTGLKTTDGSDDLHGFTIAGADGIYVNAKASIVDKDTVKVWNDRVAEPKNVIYAFDNFNQGANLCNGVELPASPFRTIQLNDSVSKKDPSISYFKAQDWMYADKDVWVYNSKDATNWYHGYSPSFTVNGGTYAYDTAVYDEGTASLKVTYADDFSVSPILSYESLSQDWSKFNYLTVSLKNTGAVKVSMKITSGGTTYTVPTVENQAFVTLTGEEQDFVAATFDLTKVSDAVLSALTDVTFEVEAGQAGEMYFDNFLFGMTN